MSAALSAVSWYFIQTVGALEAAGDLSGSPLDVLQAIVSGITENRELFLSVIACALVVLVVSTIRKLCSDFAWEIAIGAGSVAYLLIMLLGAVFMQAEVSVLPAVAGTIGAAVISLILEFFVYRVDYARSQYLQFEDDEYCYYVKAIPKIGARPAGRRASEDDEYFDSGEPEESSPHERPARDTAGMAGVPEEQTDPDEKFRDVDFTTKLEESLKDL